MGFYPPDSLVHEAQRRGIRVAPPDANRSRVLCHVESPRIEEVRGGLAVRIGLGYVKGVKKEEMEALVAERERGGPYEGIADLASRSGAGLPSLESLAWAGALDGIPASAPRDDRREALWRRRRHRAGRQQRQRHPAGAADGAARAAELEPLGEWGKLIADYRSTGMTRREAPDEAAAPRPRPEARSAAPT